MPLDTWIFEFSTQAVNISYISVKMLEVMSTLSPWHNKVKGWTSVLSLLKTPHSKVSPSKQTAKDQKWQMMRSCDGGDKRRSQNMMHLKEEEDADRQEKRQHNVSHWDKLFQFQIPAEVSSFCQATTGFGQIPVHYISPEPEDAAWRAPLFLFFFYQYDEKLCDYQNRKREIVSRINTFPTKDKVLLLEANCVCKSKQQHLPRGK